MCRIGGLKQNDRDKNGVGSHTLFKLVLDRELRFGVYYFENFETKVLSVTLLSGNKHKYLLI